MTVKKIFTILLLPLVVAQLAVASESDSRNPREYFFTHSFGDLPEEMQLAGDEGKQGMLLFFESEGCPYCLHMLNNVFNQRAVQDWYQDRFVSIAVDIHGDVELKDFDGITLPSKIFSEQRRIFVTPIMSFINLEGIEIYQHVGMIRTPAEFLLLGQYIEDEHYFDTEYAVFRESQGLQNDREKLMTPAGSGDGK